MKTRIAAAAFGKAIPRALGIEYSCFRMFSLDLDSLPEPTPLPPGYRCAEVTGDEVRAAGQPVLAMGHRAIAAAVGGVYL